MPGQEKYALTICDGVVNPSDDNGSKFTNSGCIARRCNSSGVLRDFFSFVLKGVFAERKELWGSHPSTSSTCEAPNKRRVRDILPIPPMAVDDISCLNRQHGLCDLLVALTNVTLDALNILYGQGTQEGTRKRTAVQDLHI